MKTRNPPSKALLNPEKVPPDTHKISGNLVPDSSKADSVSSLVRAVLVKAWRERWNEIRWGVCLKRVLANCSDENCDLAEILLQQALVGTSPNTLVMSYLRHAISSQLISHNIAYRNITKFEDFNRPYCILGLVELIESVTVKFSFACAADSPLVLSRSLQKLLHWLLLCILKSLQRLAEGRQTQEHVTIIDRTCTAIQKIMQGGPIWALLYIARSEDNETYREYEQTEVNVRGTVTQLQQNVISIQQREKVIETLRVLGSQEMQTSCDKAVLEVSHLSVCPTVNALVALEAVLNPTNDVQPFLEQLFVIEKLAKLNRAKLYCELMRACFMGLIDSNGGQEELKWAAFTFLKLPHVLLRIQRQSPGQDFSHELELGFDTLLRYVPLLDVTDLRLNCDCVTFLLKECQKYSLLTEIQGSRLQQRRNSETQKPRPTDAVSNTQPSVSLILRAEPTVTSILKTLDADYSKNQEPLLGVLSHMLSGKSFELILAAAAATAKLQSFAIKLVKFNEFARQATGEGGKAANTRALLFDISFLMLCHIAQLYGAEIITSSPDCSESFFAQWSMKCLPEDGKYKCIENSSPSDQHKVDLLLNQFTNGGEHKNSMARWHEICMNAPFAMQEVLFAWEHGALTADNVKNILDCVKKKMCCLPVVVSAWLCSYMNTVGEEARSKPHNMLEQLSRVNPDSQGQYPSENYHERSHLMSIILCKMSNDILPASRRSTAQQYIPPKALPGKVMDETTQAIFENGWVDLRSLHALEQLLNLCGSDWFSDRLVAMMLTSNRLEDLSLSLSLSFALCHMDLENITLSLLLHTLPNILSSPHKMHMLENPRGAVLAKLCVMCIVGAQMAKSNSKDSFHYTKRGRKRQFHEVDWEEPEEENRKNKMRKVHEPQITLDSEGFNLDFITAKEEGEPSPPYDTKDPLNKAVLNIMRMMNSLLHSSISSPRTGFVAALIEEAVRCGRQYSRLILQFMPQGMVTQLLKCLPGCLTNQQILSICDLSTTVGRKVAAKAIYQNAQIKKA
ncbi:mediator of RNA polymerase II transcription subunit 24-like isoform X5 [Argonauta hians]